MQAIWQALQAFTRGKRASVAIITFRTHLERNLLQLAQDLQSSTYQHGGYESFIVHDPKRRDIAVASVRDRIVHRLLYEYLVSIWDKAFCYDAWSCRRGKGLQGALQRTNQHMKSYRAGWLWRSDITKFFDTVDHDRLRFILRTKVKSPKAINLLDTAIHSYNCQSVSQSVSPSTTLRVNQFMVCPSVI